MAFYPTKNDKGDEKEKEPKKRKSPEELIKTYGDHVKARHDWIDRLDHKIPGSDKTFRQVIKENEDIENPSLFLASLFEEGTARWMAESQRFNEDALIRKDIAEGKYPYKGWGAFGLDTIGNRVDDFIKKGYLPADFKNRYKPADFENEHGKKVKSGDFRSIDDVILAKKAFFKAEKENFENWMKEKNMNLSDNAKDFFQVVAYNGGQGLARDMATSWGQNGMLKHDKFLKEAPPSDSYHQTWLQNMRRIQGSNMLKNESGIRGRDIVWQRPFEEIIPAPERKNPFGIPIQAPQRTESELMESVGKTPQMPGMPTVMGVSGRPVARQQMPSPNPEPFTALPERNLADIPADRTPPVKKMQMPAPNPNPFTPMPKPALQSIPAERIPVVPAPKMPAPTIQSPLGPLGKRNLATIPETPERVIQPQPIQPTTPSPKPNPVKDVRRTRFYPRTRQ